MSEKKMVPDGGWIQRGDPWYCWFRFPSGTELTNVEFHLHLKHSRWDEDPVEAEGVLDFIEDDPPRLLMVVGENDTRTLPHNVYEAELQAGAETWARLLVPVTGEITVVEL